MTTLKDDLTVASAPVAAILTADRKYDVDSRKRLDTAIAAILKFGQKWLPDDTGVLAEEFERRQILPPRPGENRWLQIIYLTTGYHDISAPKVSFGSLKGLTPFKRRSFLNKYAGALRLLDENGVSPEEVAAYIEEFRDLEFGSRLVGMVAKDRATHGTPRNMYPLELLDEAVKKILPAGAPPAIEVAFTQAWGFTVDGKFVVGGLITGSEARAKARAVAFAKGGGE